MRLRDAVWRAICDRLRDAYPFRQQPCETKCFEGAYRDGVVRADAAIRDARLGGYSARGTAGMKHWTQRWFFECAIHAGLPAQPSELGSMRRIAGCRFDVRPHQAMRHGP